MIFLARRLAGVGTNHAFDGRALVGEAGRKGMICGGMMEQQIDVERALRRVDPQSEDERVLSGLLWEGRVSPQLSRWPGYVLLHGYITTRPVHVELREDQPWTLLVDAVLRGAERRAREVDEALPESASHSASLEAELLCARAMMALRFEDADVAVHATRRLAIHARTHELSYFELLSGLLVARAKRSASSPVQALRILSALDSVFPQHWSARIAWERTLAGEQVASEDLCTWAKSVSDTDQEARCFLALARVQDVAVPVVDEWRQGLVDEAPYGITLRGKDDRNVWVCVEPTGARRETAFAKEKMGARVELPPPRQEGQRTYLVLARLALADGMCLSREKLFERVFGYPFESKKHSSLLRVTLNRVNEMLSDHASIQNDVQVFRLVVKQPFSFVDPYQVRKMEDRVLGLLATVGQWLSAAEIGERLGVPRRTVVDALQALELEETCERERRGATVCFRVEDTTFYEPSITRLRGFAKPAS